MAYYSLMAEQKVAHQRWLLFQGVRDGDNAAAIFLKKLLKRIHWSVTAVIDEKNFFVLLPFDARIKQAGFPRSEIEAVIFSVYYGET